MILPGCWREPKPMTDVGWRLARPLGSAGQVPGLARYASAALSIASLGSPKALEKSSALIIPRATLDKKLLTLDPFLRLLFRQALTNNENFGSP